MMYDEMLQALPTADLDIFGLTGEPDFERARRLLRLSNSSCLFVRGSEQENVLA